ncbi:Cysteine synthase 2 [Dimargaris xerosporica]|nr:Cysteine synthase 2 [Dimargaris xerosporica]
MGALSPQLTLGLLVGLAIGIASQAFLPLFHQRARKRRPQSLLPPDVHDACDGSTADAGDDDGLRVVEGIAGLIGNTPMVRIPSLSEATGCDIYAKAEFLNPGGSPKDRVALTMVETAELTGQLIPYTDGCLFEGTVRSTGISLAMIARAKGYRCHIVMPDDQAQEKYALLERLNATVEKVRPVSIVNSNHFVNVARRRAREYSQKTSTTASLPGESHHFHRPHAAHRGHHQGYFADQFENPANFAAHFNQTGPEIYRQMRGQLDAFVAGAGTGGTLAGITRYLKPRLPQLKIVLADPTGSGLFHRIKHGVLYSPLEAEGTRRRHQVDTVVEGIGINRITRNFAKVLEPRPASASASAAALPWVDDAVHVTDAQAVLMARYLVNTEGLFVGSSSAVNCVAAVRTAQQLGPGHTIVTVLCDSGQRHLTKFWNDEYLQALNLPTHFPDSLTFLD